MVRWNLAECRLQFALIWDIAGTTSFRNLYLIGYSHNISLILAKCYISISPENVKKQRFLTFSGGIETEYLPKMG